MTEREIKFRFWDKHNEKFIYCDLFDINKGVLSSVNTEDHIPQQYTGLKDKNGKDIYEGDIVEKRRERGLVDFNDKNYAELPSWNLLLYQYIPYRKDAKFSSELDMSKGWVYADKRKDGKPEPIKYYYGCPPDKSWEVVGNIFEGVDK